MKCIDSIKSSSINEKLIEIIVVDNGSKSNVLKNLQLSFFKIISNNENKGFGAACNIGFNMSNSEYVLFLNPDTKVFKNTLTDAIKFMDENSECTVLGCQQVDEYNNVLKTCTTGLTLSKYLVKSFYIDKLTSNFIKSYQMSYWSHSDSRQVDHVMGSFYMLKSDEFKKMKGFDEDFFVYYEDLDLSKRILDHGGCIFFNSDFKIYHETGGSSKNVKAYRTFYSLDAILTFGSKHFSKCNYILLKIFVFAFEPFLRIFLSLIRLNFRQISQVLLAYKFLYTKRILK